MQRGFVLFLIMLSNNCFAQYLTDIATAQNIQHSDISIDEGGVGVSFFDFDNDGWDDLTFIKQNDSLLLYKNMQGAFTLLPTAIPTPGEPKQAIWVDYDNNEINDLLITYTNGPVQLWHNNGNFTFTDVTFQSGLSLLPGPNNGAAFGDFNKDGYLDLYLSRYALSGDANNPDHVNALYKNNGNGTFTNIAFQAGVTDSIKASFQAVWLDYDNDGWPDIYVINDQPYDLNSLYRNNGDETFTNVSVASGSTNPNSNPMSNSVADFDNDGDLDIFMTGKGSDVCRLLVNNNDGTFTESASSYGVDLNQFFWGAVWVDLNNDSYQDLFIVSDNNTPQPGNYELMSNQANYFVNSPQNVNTTGVASSRSLGTGDANNDGNADIVVSNRAPTNSYLWRNYGTAGNYYVKISLRGTVSNRMAIGSWIKLYIDGNCYTKYTMCGENFMGQSSQHLLFGIGTNIKADSVIVIYPSGIIDKYYDVLRNSTNYFIEGETFLNSISYNSSLNICTGDTVILDAGNYSSYLWSNGANSRYLPVIHSGSYWVDVTNQQGIVVPSDTISVFVANIPQISINAQDISCSGLTDGQITLNIFNQTSDFTIQWNQGLQGDTLENLSAGNYIFEYNDVYGCSITDSITINAPYALNISSQISPYTLAGYGSIYSIINGGTPPYSVYLDGNLESNLIDSLLPGTYLYEIYDANGCLYAAQVQIIDQTITGINSSDRKRIIIENPIIGNEIKLNTIGEITAVSVFNYLGQLIPCTFENNKLHFETDYRGLLYLKIITDGKEQNCKVLKL